MLSASLQNAANANAQAPPASKPAETAQQKTEGPAKDATAKPKSGWRAFGRVTDGNGQPMKGVEVWAHAGLGTLRRTGKTATDADGRYTLDFGPGIRMLIDQASSQAAHISVHHPGHFERNLSRQGAYIAVTGTPTDEDLREWKKNSQGAFTTEPVEINFVMLPAASASGRLVGEDDNPLAGYSVYLTGAELPPGCSVCASSVADETGRFSFENIPTTVPFQFEVRKSKPKPPWDDTWASASLKFAQPEAGNDLAVRFGERDIRSKELVLRVTGPGVHFKTSIPKSASDGKLQITAPKEQDVIESTPTSLKANALVLTLHNDPRAEVSPSLVSETAAGPIAKKSKLQLTRTAPNNDGEFELLFQNPAGSKLERSKQQVIFQVFVGVSKKPIKEKIFKQLEISDNGRYTVPVKVAPDLIADSRVSITFVTIQPDHEKWVDDFFQRGKGTTYKGMWLSDGGLVPTIPIATAETK